MHVNASWRVPYRSGLMPNFKWETFNFCVFASTIVLWRDRHVFAMEIVSSRSRKTSTISQTVAMIWQEEDVAIVAGWTGREKVSCKSIVYSLLNGASFSFIYNLP